MHRFQKDPYGYSPGDVLERLNRCISSGVEGQDYTFIQRDKNEALFSDYIINSRTRKEILLSLTLEDFIKWEYSENTSFANCIVYFFEKTVKLIPRYIEDAKEKDVELYIKFTWNDNRDGILVVISFHEKEF